MSKQDFLRVIERSLDITFTQCAGCHLDSKEQNDHTNDCRTFNFDSCYTYRLAVQQLKEEGKISNDFPESKFSHDRVYK